MEENKIESMSEPKIERLTKVDDKVFNFLVEDFKDVRWDRARLEEFLSSEDNILLVAKKEERGAGLLRGHFLHRYDNKGTEILLHEIDVSPDFQRQGIATLLIKKLKEIATENAAGEIWVITNRSNTAAMALYEKTGGRAPSRDDVVFVYDL